MDIEGVRAMLVLWPVLVAVAAAGIALANRRYGHAALVVVLGVLASAGAYLTARESDSLLWLLVLLVYTAVAGWLAARASNRHYRVSRVVLGGLVGVLPGVLLLAVPVVLASMDVITSDQSQIGFLGIPLALMGLLVGALLGGLTGRPRPDDAQAPEQPQAVPGP